MTPEQELELARMELELLKVSAGKAEMNFNIKQRQAEIRRILENVKVQENREEELKKKLAEMNAALNSTTEKR